MELLGDIRKGKGVLVSSYMFPYLLVNGWLLTAQHQVALIVSELLYLTPVAVAVAVAGFGI